MKGLRFFPMVQDGPPIWPLDKPVRIDGKEAQDSGRIFLFWWAPFSLPRLPIWMPVASLVCPCVLCGRPRTDSQKTIPWNKVRHPFVFTPSGKTKRATALRATSEIRNPEFKIQNQPTESRGKL